MGMNWIVDEPLNTTMLNPTTKPSVKSYDQWAREFIVDGLRDHRYGQSFCNRFGITDNILYYSTTVTEADQYIQEHYIK